MTEMVNLIHTCIVSSKENYCRMILLNPEKQCIYMYRGRRRRAAAAAAEGEEDEVSLGLVMTNTEIFHIFNIFSLFNLSFFHIFQYHFTIQRTFLP